MENQYMSFNEIYDMIQVELQEQSEGDFRMGEYDEDNLQPYVDRYEESLNEPCDPEAVDENGDPVVCEPECVDENGEDIDCPEEPVEDTGDGE